MYGKHQQEIRYSSLLNLLTMTLHVNEPIMKRQPTLVQVMSLSISYHR